MLLVILGLVLMLSFRFCLILVYSNASLGLNEDGDDFKLFGSCQGERNSKGALFVKLIQSTAFLC